MDTSILEAHIAHLHFGSTHCLSRQGQFCQWYMVLQSRTMYLSKRNALACNNLSDCSYLDLDTM